MEGYGRSWELMESHGRSCNFMEGPGRSWKVTEGQGKKYDSRQLSVNVYITNPLFTYTQLEI